jgi:carboxypeptidase Taq
MDERIEELKRRLAEVVDLTRLAKLAGWDQQVMMPRGGAPARAEQMATLRAIIHERFIDDRIGVLLEELRPYEEGLPADSDDAALIRVVRHDYDKARRVPTELAAELARASSRGHQIWVEARAESNFQKFLPVLRHNLELKHRYIECFEPADEPYDVLLDDYEQGAKTADVRAVFARLKDAQVPLIAVVRERAGTVNGGAASGPFPIDRQRTFVRSVLDRFGFDEAAWRLDLTVHPFATNTAIDDIRITTRYSEDSLSGLFGAMHEFGHGLYEHGSDPSLERSPLAGGVSLGLHESQSRLWENLVGRSAGFWKRFYPELQRTFSEALAGVEPDEFWRAVNCVAPSLIRVEADEVTYNLHVILRFELEQELLSGSLALEDLPEVWNTRMREYLGVEVPDDARGVLQDVHWSGGIIGYFPTYTLGNVMSVQIWEAAKRELGDLDGQIEAGEFGALREWLTNRLHRYGRKFAPNETLERVAGSPIDPEPYLGYLKQKVEAVYGSP